jgi:iron complex transport system ATP-binding protein
VPRSDQLVLDGVTAGYGRPVVHEVSFTVHQGEVVGLIGPNGSGKTTLVRVASRALPPIAGRALVTGRDPYTISAREAARLVAVVPQEVAPVFAFSAREVVSMGRSPYLSAWGSGGAEDFRRIGEAMRLADVAHLADRPLSELSGGEKQRVVLAQALVQDAPVLLLDEPTTHLDARHVVGILDTVQRLARERGKTVLAIFHDLNLAAAYSDRVVAMEDGRVVLQGTPEEVIGPPLLRDVYGLEAEVVANPITGRPLVILVPGASRARELGLRASG